MNIKMVPYGNSRVGSNTLFVYLNRKQHQIYTIGKLEQQNKPVGVQMPAWRGRMLGQRNPYMRHSLLPSHRGPFKLYKLHGSGK